MATTSFTPDAPKPALDEPLERVGNAASTLEKHIRLRLQPDLYNWETRKYQAWHGLTWYIDVGDVAEGRRLRGALADFFMVFGGSARQQEKLCRELGKLAEGLRG